MLSRIERQVDALAARFLDAYQSPLRAGKAGSVDRDTADGMVKTFLHHVGERKRALLVDGDLMSKYILPAALRSKN
jgi:hypothetical protein